LFIAGSNAELTGDLDKATGLYHSAIALEPAQADAAWRLYHHYKTKHQANGNPDDRRSAQIYLQKALRSKKDIRYVQEWMDFQREHPAR
jgi:hypothetical protein